MEFSRWVSLEIGNTYFTGDVELRRALQSIYLVTENKWHMGMEWRIKNELDKRAACGGLCESGALKHGELRNRLMLEWDIAHYG